MSADDQMTDEQLIRNLRDGDKTDDRLYHGKI